jgi:PAS domain S-box-containing protein
MGGRDRNVSHREAGSEVAGTSIVASLERAPAESAPVEGAAEARLRETTALIDSIVENVPHMIFVKEAATLRFVRVNRAAEELLGVPRAGLLGKNDFDFFPAAQAEAFQKKDRETLRSRVVELVPEEPIETRNGPKWLRTKKIALFDEHGAPAFLLGISEDVTLQREMRERVQRAHEDLELRVVERTAKLQAANEDLKREIGERQRAEAALRASEDQLRQAQKMEAIGQLAAGVAHDFNNLLSVVVGYAQVVLTELPAASPLLGFVQEIHTAGLRAAKLTKQLLAFGRKQVLMPRVLDLNEVIQDMASMLTRIIGEDVELSVVTADGPTLARLDPTQVEQVVMNLVVNARDAMPEGGKLTIETRNVILDDEFARAHLGVSPGPFVMLSVTDTGVGMDAATQARVFEPFFTTKPSGRGTGLGLSTVFGIVQQSGGTIWVTSEPGRGASFRAYFPAASEASEASEATVTPAPLREAPRGDETVLLVEDDPQVRALVESVLRREGYEILEAASAEEAIALSDTFARPIHLLLTDVVMPKMSGPEAAQVILERRPDVKVLFMSGYADSALLREGRVPAGQLLEKPVDVAQLTRRVRDLLDEGGG